MTSDAHRVREAFEHVLTLPLVERDSWLASLSARNPDIHRRVEQLLCAHAKAGLLPTLAIHQRAANVLEQIDDHNWEGRRLGAYRLEHLLARGGMGMVYRARRDDEEYEQYVAIKVLPHHVDGAILNARSRRERQILADLQHPNISRLLDGGTDEQGRPFLVLEYVEGVSITQYCDRRNADLATRARLLVQLCDALSHAHRHLIVHCDIKPGNVLVTADGQVKLLDFGIAQLLGQDPEHTPLLTPSYASPEQRAGQAATVASDLYALGVLSHELLSGHLPRFDDAAGPVWMSRLEYTGAQAQQRGLTTAYELRLRLRGDLEWIVWQALQADPDQRYASASRLADDLRGWLNHYPVSAHPVRRTYRIKKWVRRQPWLAASVSALVLASVSYAALIHHSNVRLAAEREAALTERRQSIAAQQFMLDSLRVVGEHTDSASAVALDSILSQGAERAESQLAADPQLQGLVWQQTGHTQIELGNYASAERWLRRALHQQQAMPTLNQAATLTSLARVMLATDRGGEAVQYAQAALDVRDTFNEPPHPGRVLNHQQLAYSAHLRGDYGTAIEQTQQALKLAYDVPAISIPIVAAILRDQAVWLTDIGDNRAATEVLQEGLALYRERQLPADASYVDMQQIAAILDRTEGRYQQAEVLFRQNLALRSAWYGRSHPDVAISLNNLALTLTFQGRMSAAEPLYREALTIRQQYYGDEHTLTVESINNLAFFYYDQQRYEQAEPLFRQAWETAPKAWGSEHSNLAIFQTNLAAVQLELGDASAACDNAEAAAQRVAATLGANHWRWAVATGLRGACLHALGNQEKGIAQIKQAITQLEQQLGVESSYAREARARAARMAENDKLQWARYQAANDY